MGWREKQTRWTEGPLQIPYVSDTVDGADIDLGKADKSELAVFTRLSAVSSEEFATASGASPPLASGFWLKPRFL